jgi:hypothetical protein
MSRLFRWSLAAVLVLSLLGVALGQGPVTKIKDIQMTTDPNGDSPLNGQVVTISGIVSAEPYAFGGKYYFVQDSVGAWSGIKVYDPGRQVAYGDSVILTGTVKEFYGVTEITNVTYFAILDTVRKEVPPVLVSTGEIGTGGTMAEAYEGVLVQVRNVKITNPDLGYGEWEVDDGTGPCRVDDAAEYYFDPSAYDSVKSITGVLDYSYGNTKIEPRLAYDVEEWGPFTRIQRIQQVRYSDLMRAPFDNVSDKSYMEGDTVTVTGVVTMPTGLSYAGAGIKFIFADPNGGPWSALLSYHPDSTAYPDLFEGDSIVMTGYVGEYTTGPSNMTEFWITSPIQIVGIDAKLPPVDTVRTGDLRWPTTAEQWGTVIVAVKNAVVKRLDLQYEMFSIDDGSGEILVDDDSDSLQNYPDPPQGTILESVRGWVYHHFGSYSDSTTYKLEPLYKSDIVLGQGPPAIRDIARDPAIPQPTTDVTVSANVITNLNLTAVELFYRVDGGAFSAINMTAGQAGGYAGAIPAQAEGSFVEYFIKATDELGQTTIVPDTSLYFYGYPVTSGQLSIANIQYSPWKLANSPFEGTTVTVTGIVTSDTTMNNNYGAYSIQDQSGAWNGLFIFGAKKELFRGDQVKVVGTVTDYNPAWHFKWDNNTVILVDTVEVLSQGNTEPQPVHVTTGDLGDAAKAEQYEGVLVHIKNATITKINRYDVTVDDGSGPCLIDGDGLVSNDRSANSTFYINQTDGYLVAFGDTLRVGDVVDYIQGVFTFSFGTYKIEVRDNNDFGQVTGVNENPPTYPLTFELEQNFPNPFNPETRIYFSVPVRSHVKIIIYNALGQIVRRLVDQEYEPGRHILNWDGRNDAGLPVPSGIYFYRMKAGDFLALRKMLLIR